MKIIGLGIEKYIGDVVSGHNCDFKYTKETLDRYVILGVEEGKKYEISLWEDHGECCSGWTTASWGMIKVKQVEKFNGYNYVPKGTIVIPMVTGEEEWVSNDVFKMSCDGGDSYYPSGYISVNMGLFKETKRIKHKRPVWVFIGKSNVGKSFIGSHLRGLSVYETDSSDTLPEAIEADVVILGNKYRFTTQEIDERIIGEHELCIVSFDVQE